MKHSNVLIVEDEEDISSLLRLNLEADGFSVDILNSGDTVCSHVEKHPPDIILLDVMIPKKDGFEVCKELKNNSKTSHIPVIFLTAKALEHNVISGLEIGADDYISKPFSISVLISRIKAVLRRFDSSSTTNENKNRYAIGDLTVDLTKMTVKTPHGLVALNTTEFRLLVYLMDKPGWVFNRSQLIDACKGDDNFVTDRSIDVLMVSIRKKLGEYASLVETVRGVGYKFKDIDD